MDRIDAARSAELVISTWARAMRRAAPRLVISRWTGSMRRVAPEGN